jgi:hypothetical protein
MKEQTPNHRMLIALRQLAGDAPSTRRFNPSEWLSVTTSLGFTDAERMEVVRSLVDDGQLRFTPETTEFIARSRDLKDPMPNDLPALREELDYCEIRLHDGEPESIWWQQVQARIDGLRHRENRFLSAVSITNNAIGPNARNNIYSTDRSVNESGAALLDPPKLNTAPESPAAKAAQLQFDFAWCDLTHDIARGAWIEDSFSPNRLQALIGWIRNPIAGVGKRPMKLPPLVAHLSFVSQGRTIEVDRAYWLRVVTNSVSIHPGQRCAIVVGLLGHDGWVTYANPYGRSPFEGIFPEVIAPLGEKFTFPRATSLEGTLSLLDADSMDTLAQSTFRLLLNRGRARIELTGLGSGAAE